MTILEQPEPLAGTVAAGIGLFDGVHLGHQAVLLRVIEEARRKSAKSLAVTFDVHPNKVVAPDRVPPLIQSTDQRLRFIAQLGFDAALVLRFDEALSQLSPADFVQKILLASGRLTCVCIGANFLFGHRRQGNATLLAELGTSHGFEVCCVPPVNIGDRAASSTRIREAVQLGDFATASELLGRPYTLAGKVGPGDGRGRTLGIPTANLDVAGLAKPANGVYSARTTVGGRRFAVAVNIGTRPTFGTHAEATVEAHLIGFEGDLYGQLLELEFIQRLRSERAFESTEALRQQIESDIESARGALS
ncbi:MAG: bifunctional riboflavin kinase/FAD synthetase [Pedosphaera sp.]|nr:bifunctional riboflavin kinase/FAD synthetase [Pedosphaera sp.]